MTDVRVPPQTAEGLRATVTRTASPARVVERRPGRAEAEPVKFAKRRRIVDNLLRIGTPIALFLIWQWASTTGVVDRRFWPPPTEIVKAFGDMVEDGVLWKATRITMWRLLRGFLAGSLLGVVAGLMLGVWRPLRIALDPIISALYTVPKLAILPLLLMMFGLGDTPIIILIAVTAFMITVISTTAAVVAVPDGYLEPAQAFGSSRFQLFAQVLAPAVLPDVFVSLRLAAGSCVLVVVGIEFVSGGSGLGHLIWNSWQLFLSDRMYVGIVTVSVLGVLFQGVIKWLGKIMTPWTRGH